VEIRERSEHSLITEVADKLRVAYRQERLVWDTTRPWKAGPQWDWAKYAKVAIEQQVSNAREFIRIQFMARPLGTRPPTPKECFGPTACSRWTTYLTSGHEKRREDLKRSFVFQKHVLESALFDAKHIAEICDLDWTTADIHRYVLLDMTSGLTALLRYSLAVTAGISSVAAHFRRAALHQYLFGRGDYDAVWGEYVPQKLRDLADRQSLPGRKDYGSE